MAKYDVEPVTVDSKAIMAKFDELGATQPEVKKSLKSAIRQALNIVFRSVKQGAATVTTNPEKINKGVNLKIYKNGSGGQVNIYRPFYLSDGKVFKLQWLEQGTKEGIGRDRRKHGATPAKPFFKSAVSTSIDRAESVLSDKILSAIEKIASKRNKS